MKVVILEKNKTPFWRIFYIQMRDILAIETGMLMVFIFSDFNIFLITQLIAIPVILYLILAKHNKSVTKIQIDYEFKRVYLTVNYFIFFNRQFDIPYHEITVEIGYKWLFKFYYEIIMFKAKNKSIAVIPYSMSIWSKAELDELKIALSDLAKEGMLNVIQSTKNKK